MTPLPLDHVVLAGPDLDATTTWFAARTGVVPAPGGSHVGLGTRNALVDLGAGAYLELIGPDPGQPDPPGPRPFLVDDLTAPRIVTWAVRAPDLDATVAAARAGGYDPGDAHAMSRRTGAGPLLEWRLTPPTVRVGEPVAPVPFVIDWGATAHPTTRDLPLAIMIDWHATHPDPRAARAGLDALGVELKLDSGPARFTLVVLGGDGTPVSLH